MASRAGTVAMDAPNAAPVSIAVSADESVSALLVSPAGAHAALVLAHGAGAGMRHPFLAAVAVGLAARGIATLRYQFPFMERGAKRVDPSQLAQATVRAAVDAVRSCLPGLPLFAGGKSFGGRMTSQAEAAAPLAGVAGLVFLGFPLHAAGRPARERAAHLAAVERPMLFLQGTRDDLADLGLIETVASELGARATLSIVDDADHAFHVRARSGRNDAEALAQMLDVMATWLAAVAASAAASARPRA
ncbi:MAG: alpha/beta family hydrolase [Caldimonas sp.]